MNNIDSLQQQQIATENGIPIRQFKYKIEQTAKGARVTVHGDEIPKVISDYLTIRNLLAEAGFKLAPED